MPLNNEQRKVIKGMSTALSNVLAMNIIYDYDGDTAKLNSVQGYEYLTKKYKSLEIDFNNLSCDDLELLGCQARGGDGYEGYYMIPIYLWDIIPKGTKVYGAFDRKNGVPEEYTFGVDYIDNDVRGGMLAFMFKACDAPESSANQTSLFSDMG